MKCTKQFQWTLTDHAPPAKLITSRLFSDIKNYGGRGGIIKSMDAIIKNVLCLGEKQCISLENFKTTQNENYISCRNFQHKAGHKYKKLMYLIEK